MRNLRTPGLESLEPRRLFSAGELDTTFGDNGISDLDPSGQDGLRALGALPGGGVFVVGTDNLGKVIFLKTIADGSRLDSAFGGGDGKVTTPYVWSGEGVNGRVASDAASGRIAVVADTSGSLGDGQSDVVMLKSDGSLDSSFGGGDGIVESSSDFTPWCVGFQSDGRLIVAGTRFDGTAADVVVRRYAVDGARDTTFDDSSGETVLANPDVTKDLQILSDGRIALATDYDHLLDVELGGDEFFGVFVNLLAADGTPLWQATIDTGVDSNGDEQTRALDLEASKDQKSLTVLYYEDNVGSHLARVAVSDGTRDASFAPAHAALGSAQHFALDDSGNILLIDGEAVTRLRADGSVDATYGAGGSTSVALDPRALLVQNGDEALVAGSHNDGTGILLTRLQGGAGVAIPTITLNRKGTLVVTTLDADENIQLSIRARDGRLIVRVNDFAQSFAPSKVKRIAVFAAGGNDVVTNLLPLKGIYADGGEGNDTLNGGVGGDVLLGGLGKDKIYGNDGNDILLGGGGNDYLLGGAGKDDLFGNGGVDTLSGAGGNDRLFGGDLADILHGGAGDDSSANDPLDSRDGIETLL